MTLDPCFKFLMLYIALVQSLSVPQPTSSGARNFCPKSKCFITKDSPESCWIIPTKTQGDTAHIVNSTFTLLDVGKVLYNNVPCFFVFVLRVSSHPQKYNFWGPHACEDKLYRTPRNIDGMRLSSEPPEPKLTGTYQDTPRLPPC